MESSWGTANRMDQRKESGMAVGRTFVIDASRVWENINDEEVSTKLRCEDRSKKLDGLIKNMRLKFTTQAIKTCIPSNPMAH